MMKTLSKQTVNGDPNTPCCPSLDQLTGYVFGCLPDPDFDCVAGHVSTCTACQSTLDQLDDVPDLLVARLREVPALGSEPTESPELLALMLRAEEIECGVHPANELPQRLGQYEIVGLLGRGGMGAVYKAFHTNLKRFVAVKALSRERASNPEAVLRFEREMEAVGRLSHPNIALAHDAGQLDGTLFLATELVEGLDLAKLVKRHGPLSIADACEVVRQAALGLDHAHGKGLVHRDVKPSNLMVSSTGVVKLLDLGLARFRTETVSADETSTGVWLGTVDYMAPEQAEDPRKVDAKSDLYSLGCTLFHLLVGHAPFAGQEHNTPFKKMTAHAREQAPVIRSLRPDVPKQLSGIIGQLLSKDPSLRRQTAHDLADALTDFASGADLASLLVAEDHREGPDTRLTAETVALRDSPRRNAWLVVGTSLVVLCGVAAALIYLVNRNHGSAVVASSPDGLVAIDTEPQRAIVPFTAAEARCHQERWSAHLRVPVKQVNSIGMTLALIPPGEFMMGTANAEMAELLQEAQQFGNERILAAIRTEAPPQRAVISRPFYIGIDEVTVGQFRRFVKATGHRTAAETDEWGGNTIGGKHGSEFTWSSPGFPQGENHPVGQVTWGDAVAFCDWLTSTEGQKYALPTEAQWEYACRAGTTTRWYFGDDPQAISSHIWPCIGNDCGTGAVGQKSANAFGLFDVYGNVSEWCSAYDRARPMADLGQVLRGGQVGNLPILTRSAMRADGNTKYRHALIGFRVVRTID